ncbi:ArsR family transcriptional regulator [Novosphingobium nitrogenifigens DSM 19370]|uniref:ArsR family transcriptional regulator n=1 Tax=Novosphingobium nitrogenifigens DSM 19370 TaxID=983920 RepID=F1ZCK8_9SPHN|nr:metalloregulator ArsR/SmtB family transcription factor [Novosphingobium nitrogenifigens]EGD57655.1 ArsR family transcriptional regulator [Novosphingobium nitrogenifigens DSM 19370]
MTATISLLEMLRALADPTRLRIMRLLASMELAVGELAQVLGQSQPRVSRHVKILCDAGLAERRREGAWVFLRAQSDESRGGGSAPLVEALGRLLALAEDGDCAFAAQCTEDRVHLDAIRATRQAHAQDYFTRHAAQWDRLRSLHIADGPVEQALTELLREAANGEGLGRLLDVGTGTGRMAELFAPLASRVAALDRSPDMLRLARTRLQHLPAGKVELVQGDFAQLPFASASFDTLLFHQVLHYAQAPEAVLAEAARVTAPGGRIAIVDFAAHDREELRTRHAHARLGFADAQMAALFAEAGFEPLADRALAGKELIVKLWTAVRRAPSASHDTGNR